MSAQIPPSDDQNRDKDKYLKFIDEINHYSQQIKNSTDLIGHIASFGLDYTNLVRASGYIPPNTNYGTLNPTLAEYRDHLGRVASALQPPANLASGTLTSGATAVHNTIYNTYGDEAIQYLSFADQEKAKQERTLYSNLILRDDRKMLVLSLLKQLGFDDRDEGKRTISVFTTAWDQYSSSPSLYNTAFLGMRQTMSDIVNELGHLCNPIKTAPQRQLIIYIGEQLGAGHTNKTLFENIGNEWLILFEKLQNSEAKKGAYSIEQTHGIMGDTVLLLIKLLSSIDPQKT
jgi:hypothetical protein